MKIKAGGEVGGRAIGAIVLQTWSGHSKKYPSLSCKKDKAELRDAREVQRRAQVG